jgi:hypothetical protein
MGTKNPSNSRSHLWIGLLIIFIGIVSLLDNFDIIDAGEVYRFWPVIFIFIGYFKVTGAMSVTGRIIGLIFVALGILLVLDKLYYIDFHFWDWWPLILILIGGGLLMSRTSVREKVSPGTPTGDGPVAADAVISLFAFMSGFKRLCNSQGFLGGEVTAIMGGCEIDLRQAVMKNDSAVITIFAFWGGVTIKVPQDWNVSVQGIPILGGLSDKTHPVHTDVKKHLIIRGQIIMGGAEISN